MAAGEGSHSSAGALKTAGAYKPEPISSWATKCGGGSVSSAAEARRPAPRLSRNQMGGCAHGAAVATQLQNRRRLRRAPDNQEQAA